MEALQELDEALRDASSWSLISPEEPSAGNGHEPSDAEFQTANAGTGSRAPVFLGIVEALQELDEALWDAMVSLKLTIQIARL